MPAKEKSTFSHFFKEDAEVVQDIIYGGSSPQIAQNVGNPKKETFPTLHLAKKVKDEEFKQFWRRLRSFFRNANSTEELNAGFSPLLMAPLYTKNMIGTDYPVWVADEAYQGNSDHCLPLKEILTRRLTEIGPCEEEAHILKENIERIIHIANEYLADKKPHLSHLTTKLVLDELERQLDVSGDELQPFKENLNKLRSALPDNGVLLPYTSNTSLQLLEAAMVATRNKAREALKYDIKQLICRLKDILRVEREKGPERNDPAKLHDSLEFADNMMNFEELSAMLPGSGSEIMSDERKQRIASIVETLEQGTAIMDQKCFVFVDELLHNRKKIDWEHLLDSTELVVYEKGQGVASVKAAFDEHMAEWTALYKAKRIGELEFRNAYQKEIHDDFFDHFMWQNFTMKELNTCPYFILVADDVRLFENEFSDLSSLLSENIPVKIVGVKRGEEVTHPDQTSGKSAGWHANTELGALMLSYKNIFIAQATSITPEYLFNGFKEGLAAFAPAFFYLLNVDRNLHEDSYLWTSASVESRDFPGFIYRGLLGTSWGSRFEVYNNPQPNEPWPLHDVKYIGPKGEKKAMVVPFTFTDRAVLNPAYSHHFKWVKSCYYHDDLIPLKEFMENPDEVNIGKVPFIWMMNEENQLQKIAVSWSMVLATQERLDFWHFLQENSGINNFHVNKAVEDSHAAMLQEQEKRIAILKAEHEEEILRIKEEEAGLVMENLTSVLLDLDTSPIALTGIPRATPKKQPAPPVEDAAAEMEEQKEVEEEDILLSNDPYIETSLCTTCNECTELNGSLFKYNDDKLAYIADPKAGSFSDLVEAAEKCPVAIIHPGSPLNPSEDGLEDLIKRAEKFN